jgi:hypothetical protein
MACPSLPLLLLPLLLLLASLRPAAPALPPCTPYQPPAGHWDFPPDGSLQWDPAPAANATAPPCAWATPTLRALAQCMPGATLVFGGDSVVRYMVTTLGLEAWRCGEAGAGGEPETPERAAACSALYGLKERKADAVVVTPPEWGAHNLTLHFRYLRFGYEFLDRATAWQPDHLREPAAADAILLGGMGYWDARYRTHDTLLNVLARLGEDMAPLFAANPTLRRKLTVLSTTYSENFDGRMGMFPHDILEAINAAAAPVWRAMGVPWFDVTRYVRAAGAGAASEDLAGRMAASGGKLLTQDGYHPRVEVQRLILAEVFSHMCAVHARSAGAAGAAAAAAEEEAAAAAAARAMTEGGGGGGGGGGGAQPPSTTTTTTTSSGSGSGSKLDRLVAGPLAAPLVPVGGGAAAGMGWGALAAEEAAGCAALALLSCCCLSSRGKRCRRRCCTRVGLCCGCLK